MKGKSFNKGSEKAPDESARNNVTNSRVETLKNGESEDQGFKRGGKVSKKKAVHGSASSARADKKERRGKFAKGGKVDGRSIETIATGGDKKKVESNARKVNMRNGWKPFVLDQEDN